MGCRPATRRIPRPRDVGRRHQDQRDERRAAPPGRREVHGRLPGWAGRVAPQESELLAAVDALLRLRELERDLGHVRRRHADDRRYGPAAPRGKGLVRMPVNRSADEDVEGLPDPAPVRRARARAACRGRSGAGTSSMQASCLRRARRSRLVSCRDWRSVSSRSTRSPRRSSTTTDESNWAARAWAFPTHREPGPTVGRRPRQSAVPAPRLTPLPSRPCASVHPVLLHPSLSTPSIHCRCGPVAQSGPC